MHLHCENNIYIVSAMGLWAFFYQTGYNRKIELGFIKIQEMRLQ